MSSQFDGENTWCTYFGQETLCSGEQNKLLIESLTVGWFTFAFQASFFDPQHTDVVQQEGISWPRSIDGDSMPSTQVSPCPGIISCSCVTPRRWRPSEVQEGCTTVEAVGECVNARTNCGSCRGEIRGIIDACLPVSAG